MDGIGPIAKKDREWFPAAGGCRRPRRSRWNPRSPASEHTPDWEQTIRERKLALEAVATLQSGTHPGGPPVDGSDSVSESGSMVSGLSKQESVILPDVTPQTYHDMG